MTLPAVQAAHDAATTCGAKTRAGTPCRFVAGYKTDHVGVGRCHLHGGKNPVKHGRYSGVSHVRLGALIDKHQSDPNPLDILPELAAARALFEDFVTRYDENTAALRAWHARDIGANRPIRADKVAALKHVISAWEADRADRAGAEAEDLPESERQLLADAREVLDFLRQEPMPAPKEVLDIADAYKIVAEVTKIVERIERISATGAVARGDFLRVLNAMGAVVMEHVTDGKTQEKIRAGWLTLGLLNSR